jgi:hypothetical protein
MITESKVIICAGGSPDSPSLWNNHLGIQKHMIPAHGEPIIHRTQRLLLENGFNNLYLACHEKNKSTYLSKNVNYINAPELKGNLGERSLVWHYKNYLDLKKTNIFILGDVYYSDEIIRQLSQDPGDIFKIYGRADVSTITNNLRQGEPFAIILTKKSIPLYLKCIKQTIGALPDLIEKCIACPADLAKFSYRKFVGIPYEAPGNQVESIHWINWDDLTDDFDDPTDWEMKSKLFPDIFYIINKQ